MKINIFQGNDLVDFWVWVDPDNWLVKDQITEVGGFTSGGLVNKKSNLMFIPNPDFEFDITPYQFGIMREYIVEYNLELARIKKFSNYPSRLNSIYLFKSELEASKYKRIHPEHVRNRILKKAHSVIPCLYSVHDSSWVDFLRLLYSVDLKSLDRICDAYWSGALVEDVKLTSREEPWTQEPILEVLFIGRIEFYDRSLDR